MSQIDQSYPAGPGPAPITQHELDELTDAELVAHCMAPISRRLHAEAGPGQTRAIKRLTADQAALLVFSLLYGHAGRGLSSLIRERPHRVADEDFWRLVETGLGHLGDTRLLALIARLRAEVATVLPEDVGRPDDGGIHLVETLARLDPVVLREMDGEYQRVLPESLRRAAGHNRSHTDRFI